MQQIKPIFLLAAAAIFLPLQQAFSMPIEAVDVQVVDLAGGTSAALLQKMGDSMQIVAYQLLADKDADKLLPAVPEYTRLLADIGDRVLTGYEIQQVELVPGSVTKLVFKLRPWGSTIDDVALDLQFSGVEPQTAALLAAKLPQLQEQLLETVRGAATDASDWAGGILRKIVRQQVEQFLPEFKAAVDLTREQEKTTIQVVIYPVGQLVRNIKYELRSEAIPNLLLMRLKNKYRQECDRLRGLPVAYVQRCQQEFVALLEQQLAQEADVRLYQLKPKITLIPGTDLNIEIILDSDKYKIWLEGYGDIGRDKDNLSGKAHLGKFFSPDDEIFGEAEIILDDVRWRFGFGYTRYWGKSGWSYRYIVPTGNNVYRFEYNFSSRWRLRAERYAGDNRNEYGLRYRIHEFLSAECVYGGHEWYLRLIGNL